MANVGGGMQDPEGPVRSREMSETDKVVYKNCMEKLGYKVREIEVFWLQGAYSINIPPRFVREGQK